MSTELGLGLAASSSNDGGNNSSALTWPPIFPDLNLLHYLLKDLIGRGLLYAVVICIPTDLKTIDWGWGLGIHFPTHFHRRLLEPIGSVPIGNNILLAY